ncbi:MAG: glycoside hydrolase family 13 protein [Chloroflexota bacterium]
MNIPEWVQDAVFYQIFPDRFARSNRLPVNGFEPWDSPPTNHGFKGGDLYGAAEKLDYLADLGITAIYFNPIFSSASNHRYHTYDYYNVDPLLGGNPAFAHLLKEAHKRNIRVVLDGVFNHASRGFWQFHHVLETRAASPFKDWFHFDPERLNGQKHWAVYPAHHEQEAIQREGSLRAIGYQGWWNLPALPKFNTNTPAVREFLFGVAEHWIQFGIDGWRLDVPGDIDDDSFWREFRRRVRAINPDAYIVGEIWHEAQRWLQGDQFDAVMNYLVTAAAIGFFGDRRVNMDVVNKCGGLQGRVHPGMTVQDFSREMDRLLTMYKPEITRAQLNLLDSHDMPRFLSCVSGDKNALKMAWLFLFTIPGAPCIYYGDEVGLDGGHDPDCRKSFPWDEKRWDNDLRQFAQSCIRLRRGNSVLRRGECKCVSSASNVFAFTRSEGKDNVYVAFNVGYEPNIVELWVGKKSRVLFGKPTISSNNVTIPPRSGVVIAQ